MAVSWLRHLAAHSPPSVFIALGARAEGVRETLALNTDIELVDSPRHASVLLVAGEVPVGWRDDLRRVHDQLPTPSASVWFRAEPFEELLSAIRVDDLEMLPQALGQVHRALLLGRRGSSPRLLADVPPNPWQGLGDDGHGGEGMMGGNPYGRPMAMNMQDDLRDGLTLDTLTFRLGPFHPLLPPGMVSEISLQGDLVQSWTIQRAPFSVAIDPIFHAARQAPVPIAALELARVRHHLFQLSGGLYLAGWPSLGIKVLRLAGELNLQSDIGGLRKRLARGGFFRLAQPAPGRGCLDEGQAMQIGGWAARAAGFDMDLRSRDAHYRRLGFMPVCQAGNDTRARWRQLVDEAEQSLDLARNASRRDLSTAEVGPVETPRGPWDNQPPGDASAVLETLMPGLEWGEALATLASLELAALDPVPIEVSCHGLRTAGQEYGTWT